MRRTAPVDDGPRDSSRWPEEESIICSMGVSPMSTLASSPVPKATAPITRSTPSAPVTYTGLPLMPCATPPVEAMSGPSARARIWVPPGPSVERWMSITVTGKRTMSVPRTTVRASPTIPGWTSDSGRIGSAAAAWPAAAPSAARATRAGAAPRRSLIRPPGGRPVPPGADAS